MDIRNARSAKRVATWLIGGLLALLMTYGLAGLVGGAIPSNRAWRPPVNGGIEIFVETNGVHTGIVLPKVAAGIDWRGTFGAADLADPRFGGHTHLSVGWGERRFYLETPRWSDVRLRTVLAAAFGSDDTLVHVDHVPRPAPSDGVRRVVLRPEEYRRLAAYIQGTLVSGGTRHPGYFAYDAFYQARGRYDGVRTCNTWTGDALRHAGVRIGAWTPFSNTVMAWF